MQVGRRTFLRIAGMSAALIELSQLGLVRAVGASDGKLRVLSEADGQILIAIGERMLYTGDPAMPAFRDTNAMATIDAALLQTPADVQQQLHWALMLFQYGPPPLIRRFSTFSGLDETAQDEYLRTWELSGFSVCRLAFDAFKNLCMLGYYSQDATWKGIHYDGPWIPRPRRSAAS